MEWSKNIDLPYIEKDVLFRYENYYFYFTHPFTCVIAGPTMCGKSFFIKNLIEISHLRITPIIDEIHYFYGEWQKMFSLMKNVKFFKGLPELDSYNGEKIFLLIMDDLMTESNNRLGNFFTKGAHHKNISIIYVTQNLYNSNRDQRTINLNTQYLILFKNPRDILQIKYLGRSILGRGENEFEEIYRHATSKAYGYLLVDLKQNTPDQFRYLTYILDDHPKNTNIYKHQNVYIISTYDIYNNDNTQS